MELFGIVSTVLVVGGRLLGRLARGCRGIPFYSGGVGRLDGEPSLVAALGTLEESDHHIGAGRIGVHRAELHRHFRLVPIASRSILVSHGLTVRERPETS